MHKYAHTEIGVDINLAVDGLVDGGDEGVEVEVRVGSNWRDIY